MRLSMSLDRRLALCLLAALPATAAAQGTPVGFDETYALAPDRAKVVATLIPGSEESYYYSCRERLDAGDFDSVRKILPTWIQRYGRSQRVIEIENREALLSFAANAARTYDFLRDRLGLQWNHQRVVPGERSDLPTALDPQTLSVTALSAQALARYSGTVDGFTDHALAALAATNLGDDALRSLLARLRRPDVANLPALIVRDLENRSSSGFGSLPIHSELRREQLEECLRLRPKLQNEPKFVQAYLVRLQPGADTDWQSDPTARATQLARLWEFAQRLSPAHNSLKAHVLFHWLQHDLTQGAPDKERFLAYIRLPRKSGHPNKEYVQRLARIEPSVDPSSDYPTELPPIGDDEALVRACLEQFFVREDGYEAYADYLDSDWLKGVLAETKILLGQGAMERWAALLNDPQRLVQLERRVEIAFPPTQRTRYAAGDAVSLAVDTKNVPTLLVKVFAIDSYRYHVEKQKEVDASIELDGIVANVEQTLTYSDLPLRRVRRTLELPMLANPGTYVVELVGNGISSRAVIHKGGLRYVERTAAAGQLFRIYDEAGRHLKDAAVWFGGREYGADANGEILLPFSTAPGSKSIVLHQGIRSTLAQFDHREESYALHAGVYVDREALIAGQKARIVVRPQLRLSDHAVALKLLADPILSIVATDLDGLSTPQEVRDLKLADDRELVHEIRVPERLASLQVSLRGTVRDLAGKEVALTAPPQFFAVNGIDFTAATGSVLLLRTTEGYVLEMRGKDGERQAGQTCQVALRHRDFRDSIDVALQSDATGRIALGALPGIDSVSVQQPSGFAGTFALIGARSRLPTVLHASAGEVLRVPYQGKATSPTHGEFSLLGHERDEFSHLALAGGFLELRDLAPGDYRLLLHESEQSILVRVTKGDRDGGWLLGADRMLQASQSRPLQLRAIEVAGDELQIRLVNITPGTRAHVTVTRFTPPFDPFERLGGVASPPLQAMEGELLESSYHAGRQLGDEYRYVLERRFQTKYAGNMLRRPSLLLNPWAIDDDSWNAAIGAGGGSGGKYGRRGGSAGMRRRGEGGPSSGGPGQTPHPGTFANLDYLPRGSTTLTNLVPGPDGVVHVARAELGEGQIVHVVAIDGDEAIYDSLVLAEKPLLPRARHLPTALDGAQHFIEQKRIEFVAGGATSVLGDARSAEVEIYDSIASVYRLLTTVSQDAALAEFAFLLEWPKLTPARKQELYSQHACHELHFFLSRKDPEFFGAVVKPFLANKREWTFLDHWLLGDDLRGYLETWSFAQLNLVERLLLAQRLGGSERDAVARLVKEQLELRPVDRERLDRLFDLALKSNELAEPQSGIVKFRAPMTPPGAPAAAMPAESAADRFESEDAPKADAAAAKDARIDAKEKKSSEPETLEKLEEVVQDKEFEGRALAAESDQRGLVRRLYRAVEPTKLFAEHHYWHRRLEESGGDVVAPNRFWLDYAMAPAGQPFVSPAIVETGGSFLEMMFALSLLDLPFEAGAHEVVADGDRRTLRAATPLLLVRKEVQKTEVAADVAPLLLGENFFRVDDRYRFEGGERRDAFVTDEFLVDVAYGCQVVVTNPTSSKRTTEVLLQIPAGSLPLQKGFWTKGVAVELAPYATASLEYAFYFPASGDFAHYPAHASEKGKLAAAASARTLHVVPTATKIDTTSWEHVSQQGSAAEVLGFLDRHNVQNLELGKLAWRMKDREFFQTLLVSLRARHVYDDTLWSYSILHRDAVAAREYLRHADGFLQNCGMAIESPLVSLDPVERRRYQQLELDPLVYARAHRLGSQRVIGNADLARQYAALTTLLGYQPKLDSEEWLAVTCYLLLQDRVEEALAAFAKVDAAQVHEKIQYDYLSAYLCFFTGDASKARGIAERYRAFPVPHWQARFADVLGQLDEAEGKTAVVSGEPTADALAATAPALELAVEGKNLLLRSQNLARCEVSYYVIDVEFAFSAQPFAEEGGGSAAFVQPTRRDAVELRKEQPELVIELPKEFHQQNVLVEVRGGGIVRSRTYFANALDVRFLESYGQVTVSEPGTKTPLPRTYVKVFAKLPSGEVRFHKDGYTDLRGRFDYASVSDDPNAGATRYAVLVLHEQRGAVIRDVAPPTQ